MTPEAADFLAKSGECLSKAEGMLSRWPDEAGRAAYLAGLHAAQALIVERTGRVVKTHRGVQRELSRLLKNEARFGDEDRAFLGRAYNMKAIADYETGAGAKVTHSQAKEVIGAARAFTNTLRELLS